MQTAGEIARHYTTGGLEQKILAGLRTLGRDTERIDPADLAPVDEFHMGGQEATRALAETLGLRPGMMVLDIGSGIGGPARFLARTYGVTVKGIDFTPEHVEVGRSLTRRSGLAEEQVAFQVGDAVDLPFGPRQFDAATMLHVAMNIPDKARLFRGVHRVLRPGGVFALYDPMRTGEGDLSYPLPWASQASGSFLETPDSYRKALEEAGFAVQPEVNRGEMGLAFFRRMRARIAESGPPPIGLHLTMGPDGPAKMANLIAALEGGIVAPVEMVSRRLG